MKPEADHAPAAGAQPRASCLNRGRLLVGLHAAIFILFVVFWFLLLGGVADGQRQCSREAGDAMASSGASTSFAAPKAASSAPAPAPAYGADYNLTQVLKDLGLNRRLLEGPPLQPPRRQLQALSQSQVCSREFSFAWWLVWLQCGVIVAAGLAAISPFLERFILTVTVLFTISTALLMYLASWFYERITYMQDSTGHGNQLRAVQAALGGDIVLMMLNLIYITMITDRLGALLPKYSHPALPWHAANVAAAEQATNATQAAKEAPTKPAAGARTSMESATSSKKARTSSDSLGSSKRMNSSGRREGADSLKKAHKPPASTPDSPASSEPIAAGTVTINMTE